jgi:hypothetical protein
VAVIAGVGVREYYRKLGYTEDSKVGCYQIKHLGCAIMTDKIQEFKIYDKIKIGLTLRLCYIAFIIIIAYFLGLFL